MVVEAAVATSSAIAAHSLALLAFGLDSLIELASAGVLIWRLTIELRAGLDFNEAVEERARKIAGALLFALAGYVTLAAGWNLWNRVGAEFSLAGLLVALIAIPSMYSLARAKLRIADKLDSRALRADAFEAVACAYLAIVVVLGLAAQYAFHAWWLDSLTAFGIVGLLIREGREAWRGDSCAPSSTCA